MLCSSAGPSPLSNCHACYRAVITLGDDHGNVYMLQYFKLLKSGRLQECPRENNIKDGSAPRAPVSDIVAERQGRRRPPRREVGLVPVRDPCVTKLERQESCSSLRVTKYA